MTLDPEEPSGTPAPAAGATRETFLVALLRASLAGLLLALPRAALTFPRFSAPQLDPSGLAFRTVSEVLVGGLQTAIPAALFAVLVKSRLARDGLRLTSAGFSVLLFVFAFCFASFIIPNSGIFSPGMQTRSAQIAQVVLAVCALLAVVVASPGRRVPLLRPLGALGLLALLGGSAFRLLPTDGQARWPERPNVILISLDTLRPDRLESYGYGRSTSANIQRFFENSHRFERAFAPQPFTLTSHATMMTGLEPSAHGVSQESGLDPSIPTLASELRSAGYATMAVVDGCTFMDKRFGYSRGFELYRQVYEGAPSKIAQAKELLDSVGERPFLFFFHCYDAHSDFHQAPYEARPEHIDEFAGNYTGEYRGCSPDGSSCASRYLQELNKLGRVLDAEAAAWISDTYDAGIATLDEQLQEFFDYLEATGRLENTVIILTSDHGEEFYEHSQALHGQHFVESLRVPLFIRTPDQNARQVHTLSGLIDLMPTILDLCGLWEPKPGAHSSEGQSLLPWMAGDESGEGRTYLVSESGKDVRGIRTDRGALVGSARGWELFDMQKDPLQKNNVIGDAAYAELEQELRGYLAQSQARLRVRFAAREPEKNKTSINAEEQEQLEALGYLGDEE